MKRTFLEKLLYNKYLKTGILHYVFSFYFKLVSLNGWKCFFWSRSYVLIETVTLYVSIREHSNKLNKYLHSLLVANFLVKPRKIQEFTKIHVSFNLSHFRAFYFSAIKMKIWKNTIGFLLVSISWSSNY